MKRNLKFLTIICMIFGLSFYSCDEDDSVANEVLADAPTQVIVGFDDANDGASISEGESLSFNVSLGQGLPFDTTISLEVTSTDGTTSEVSFTNDVAVSAGTTSHTFDVLFNPDSSGASQDYTFALSLGSNTSSDTYITAGELQRIVTVSDPAIIVTTIVGDVVINFTWAGTSDLDCRLRDGSGSDVDTGYSISPGEMLDFLASQPDGDYTLSIRPWTVVDTSIDFTFDFVHPTGNMAFNSTLENASGGWAQEDVFLLINKATSGGDVVYTFTQLF